MSRPETQDDYLASLIPPSVAATRAVTRRSVLRGALGISAVAALPSVLAGCGGDDDSGGGGEAGSETSWGLNESGSMFEKQLLAEAADFTAKTGIKVRTNSIEHNAFQENINNYLQGSPEDVFTWFAGYRLRFFAAKGLIGDVSDIWPLDGIPESFKQASTGDDGKQYFAPQAYYPWAVFYRKSVWQKNGYVVPKTFDEMVTLAKKMQADGLVPFAFGDKQGWPAMGTFDLLNMRLNGFDFHIQLMAGKAAWDGAEVKKVFDTWRGLLPYHQPAALGRDWEEAAQSLQQRKSGMFVLGTFMNEQFPEKDRADIDFFNYPEFDSNIGSDAIDAPIDGHCMSAKPKNEAGAKKLLQYVSSPDSLAAAVKATKLPFISANEKADKANYTPLQLKSAELVGQAKHIAQFLDRDTRPDFASTVMIPSLQAFIKNPNDIDGLVKSIESQKKSIFVD